MSHRQTWEGVIGTNNKVCAVGEGNCKIEGRCGYALGLVERVLKSRERGGGGERETLYVRVDAFVL